MSHNFRPAIPSEAPQIWQILQQAIQRRKAEGSHQWQDGYPNETVIANDIDKGIGYVLTLDNTIAGYCAVLVNDEPEYAKIEGHWLSNNDFLVIHRLAITTDFLGKGLAKKIMTSIEELALQNNIFSIKVDTNYDNLAMLAIFKNKGYTYCGEVYFRGSPRKAFEKVLTK